MRNTLWLADRSHCKAQRRFCIESGTLSNQEWKSWSGTTVPYIYCNKKTTNFSQCVQAAHLAVRTKWGHKAYFYSTNSRQHFALYSGHLTVTKPKLCPINHTFLAPPTPYFWNLLSSSKWKWILLSNAPTTFGISNPFKYTVQIQADGWMDKSST